MHFTSNIFCLHLIKIRCFAWTKGYWAVQYSFGTKSWASRLAVNQICMTCSVSLVWGYWRGRFYYDMGEKIKVSVILTLILHRWQIIHYANSSRYKNDMLLTFRLNVYDNLFFLPVYGVCCLWCIVIGLFLGKKLFERISAKTFKLIICAALLVDGLYMLLFR